MKKNVPVTDTMIASKADRKEGRRKSRPGGARRITRDKNRSEPADVRHVLSDRSTAAINLAIGALGLAAVGCAILIAPALWTVVTDLGQQQKTSDRARVQAPTTPAPFRQSAE